MTSPIIGLFVLFFVSLASHAQTLFVSKVRYPLRAEQYYVVLDITASPKHRRVFVADKPPRLIIDLYNTTLNSVLNQPPRLHPLFAKLQVIHKNNTDLRLMISLKKPITKKHFSLITDNHYSHQFVVGLRELLADMSLAKPADAPSDEKPANLAPIENHATVKKLKPVMVAPEKTTIVAIDAGHGGSDPGAHGVLGTEEKIITIAIARQLAQLINNTPHMKAVMVRKGDEFIELEERTKSAHDANASLFVSIHADANPDPTIRGASVFTFSRDASSKEAQRLANSENSVDKRWSGNNENSADEKKYKNNSNNESWVIEDLTRNTCPNLDQQNTIDESHILAKAILKNLSKSHLHRTEMQSAGFLVLKSKDIPSVLVETAFISNPEEEKNLLSKDYQKQMAEAIFKGIQAVFGG